MELKWLVDITHISRKRLIDSDQNCLFVFKNTKLTTTFILWQFDITQTHLLAQPARKYIHVTVYYFIIHIIHRGSSNKVVITKKKALQKSVLAFKSSEGNITKYQCVCHPNYTLHRPSCSTQTLAG